MFSGSNPAVCGADILEGTIKVDMPIMNKQGKILTAVKSIQQEQESLNSAQRGKQVAVAMDNVIVGRQIQEGETLYSAIPEEDFKKLKDMKKFLNKNDIEVMKEIAAIMRASNPVWGI
jgi:translation initiation factor 5B